MLENLKQFEILKEKQVTIIGGNRSNWPLDEDPTTGGGDGSTGNGDDPQ
jgi:hypothetical protein